MNNLSSIKINCVPSITWNWLKSNNDIIASDFNFTKYNADSTVLPEGISLSTTSDFDTSKLGSGIFNHSNPKPVDTRNADGSINEKIAVQDISPQNHPVCQLIDKVSPEAQVFTIKGKVSEPLVLNYDFTENSVSSQIIDVKKDAEATVIFVYKGNPQASFFRTQVIANEHSRLHLIKVELLGDRSVQLDDTAILCEDNAEVLFTQIELGGHHIDSGLHVKLNGYQAKFKSNVTYFCKNDQFLDMNHIVYHYGKKSECEMKVNGTIKDNATKAYRGTLDFKNGCCGAKGNEMEETLILSPSATNKSLPVILCDEDDIQGEHGATIGRLSKEILFYMQTRGINEEEAEKIMSRVKIQAAADLIPMEAIKNDISDYLNKLEE